MHPRSGIFTKRRLSKREQAQDLIMCLSERALVSPSSSATCTETKHDHFLQSRLMIHSRCCAASCSLGSAGVSPEVFAEHSPIPYAWSCHSLAGRGATTAGMAARLLLQQYSCSSHIVHRTAWEQQGNASP